MAIRLAVLASGGGSNLQALLDGWRSGQFHNCQIVAVMSDRPGARALDRAREAGVPAEWIDPATFSSREAFDQELLGRLSEHNVNLVCLAGFMRILSADVARTYALRMLNIHPSLLPAFGGEGMYGRRVHQAVLNSGAKVSGCTVHFVDEGTDTGPIILQSVVPVLDQDTWESLAERVLIEEHRLYPRAVALMCEGRLQVNGHRVRILEKA